MERTTVWALSGLVVGIALMASAAQAAPIIPEINKSNFVFSSTDLKYALNGAAADRLYSTTNGIGGEAGSVWNPWPGGAQTPIWYDTGVPNDYQFIYGGDVRLDLLYLFDYFQNIRKIIQRR